MTPGGNSPWNSFYTSGQGYVSGLWEPDNLGARWTYPAVLAGSAWYPASGMRDQDRGRLSDMGGRGLFWTTMASSYFNVEPNSVHMNGALRTYCFPIRCIRE